MRELILKMIDNLINQGWTVSKEECMYCFDKAGLSTNFAYKEE